MSDIESCYENKFVRVLMLILIMTKMFFYIISAREKCKSDE